MVGSIYLEGFWKTVIMKFLKRGELSNDYNAVRRLRYIVASIILLKYYFTEDGSLFLI